MDNFVCFSFQYLVILFFSKHVSSDASSCFDEYCFTYSGADVTRSFDGAMSWCATNDSSTLVVVSNKSSHDALVRFLSSSNIHSPLYINARLAKVNVDTWFLISGGQFAGDVANQSDIGKTSHYQLYAYLQRQSQVSVIIGATSPHEMNNYICKYTDDSGLNILPNTSFEHDGSLYVKYENETVGWFEARNRCYLKGGDLTTFSIISSFYTTWLNLSFRYWIGLRWKNRRWITKDIGSEIIYTRWSSGKPNNSSLDCVCIDGSSSWNWTDCDCSTERSFVCAKYRSISTTTSTTTLLSSSPSVQNFNLNSGNSTENSKLAIGVGVGVGGGVLIILVVVIIIIVIKTRKSKQDADPTKTISKGKTQKEPQEPKKPKETKVTQLTSDVDAYAAILAVSQPGLREPTTEPVVYATPEFLETN